MPSIVKQMQSNSASSVSATFNVRISKALDIVSFVCFISDYKISEDWALSLTELR